MDICEHDLYPSTSHCMGIIRINHGSLGQITKQTGAFRGQKLEKSIRNGAILGTPRTRRWHGEITGGFPCSATWSWSSSQNYRGHSPSLRVRVANDDTFFGKNLLTYCVSFHLFHKNVESPLRHRPRKEWWFQHQHKQILRKNISFGT